jgi:TRAP-type uncharacterized transport system substrate-binding protein
LELIPRFDEQGRWLRPQPVATRSRLMLEVASVLAADDDWPYRQVDVRLREQGGESWRIRLFASDAPGGIEAVTSGEADVAIVNPSAVLTLAVRGSAPFDRPLPLRAITVIPSYDQFAFAVTAQTGLTSLAEIRERRYPLRVSLRGQRDHSVHLVVQQILATAGFQLEDLTAWGGQVRYDPGLPDVPNRIGAVERGEIDAIFDEAVGVWADRAAALGMRLLPLDDAALRHLEGLGFRRDVIAKADYPGLPADVPAIDFSGFAVFTRADAPDSLITAFCAALEDGKARIPWEGKGPMPLDRMCRDTPEAPLGVPLHPAAERYWRERGYLP